jgi:hypothetical protein
MRCISKNCPLIWILRNCTIINVLKSNVKIINVSIITNIRLNIPYIKRIVDFTHHIRKMAKKGFVLVSAGCFS